MVNATACTIELWMHLGGLLNTQEATKNCTRLLPFTASCDSYTSFVLSSLLHAAITH